MQFPAPLLETILVARSKRFFAHCLLDGEETLAHCVNTGSMKGVLQPPQAAWISPASNPARKLKYTLEILDVDGVLVGVNTHKTNHIAREALESGLVPGVDRKLGDEFRAEVKIDAGRIDFVVDHKDGTHTFIEVKNVSLAEGTCARFPDSPTERGQKHLRELKRLVLEGNKAMMLYICQRGDVTSFEAAADIDPLYAELLIEAKAHGVQVVALGCDVSPKSIRAVRMLEVS